MNDLNELEIELLQLQRSALVDTQTIMQILIDKKICETSELIETRSKIESSSQDVARIDKQIESLGGVVPKVQSSDMTMMPMKDKMKALAELLKEYTEGD